MKNVDIEETAEVHLEEEEIAQVDQEVQTVQLINIKVIDGEIEAGRVLHLDITENLTTTADSTVDQDLHPVKDTITADDFNVCLKN